MTNGRGAELDLWLAAEVVDALPRALEPIGPSARASLIGLHPCKFVYEPPTPLPLMGQDQIHHVEIPLAVIGMRFDVQEVTTIRREDRSDVRSDRAEPFVRGNVEPRFLAIENEIRQFAPHQFLQDELLFEASDLQILRQRTRKFHDAVVEERRVHFDQASQGGGSYTGG